MSIVYQCRERKSYVMKYLALFLLVLIVPSAYAQNSFHLGEISWDEQLYPISSDTQATIRVIDNDMNTSSDSIDDIEIFVWSDTDQNGIIIMVNETSADSGIFGGVVHLTSQETHDDNLKVTDGDSIHAKYVDTTYPSQYVENQDVSANAFIGGTGPPVEAISATALGIFDIDGNKVNSIGVDQMVLIQTSLTNSLDSVQDLVYIVIISDENGGEVYRSHLQNILEPNATITPAISWTPEETGHYKATAMIWKSIDNPTSLSSTLEAEFDVVNSNSNQSSDDNTTGNLLSPLLQLKSGVSLNEIQCKEGLQLAVKASNHMPVCIKSETSIKLVQRGWTMPILSP